GMPALRVRGVMLAVTSLSFALAAQAWLFKQSWMLGSGMDPGRPILGSIRFDTGRSYFLLSLVPVGCALWLTWNFWRGSPGRRLRAVRDNQDAARAFGIDTAAVKLSSFAFAGFIAGIGGSIYGHALARLSASS